MITRETRLAPAGDRSEAYNYESYDYGSEAAEYQHWLRNGPGIGAPAPEFELIDLDGNHVRLSDFRGRPVVLEFGSFTCPIFADRINAMERLALEHPEAMFLVIYVREAHPGEIQGVHRSLAEKRSAAHKLVMEEALARRVLVDSVDGATHRAYGGAWNPVYVIDAAGRVVMRQAWNHPADVATALRALQSGTEPNIPESTDMLREASPRPLGQRLLDRGGLTALRDFYATVPPALQEVLRSSPSMEVRAAIEGFASAAT